MSGSPFLTPDQSRLRRQRAEERRRRNRIISLSLLAVAIAVGVIAVLTHSGGSSHGKRSAKGPQKPAGVTAAAPAPRSPDGLLLAAPALTLTGITSPAADPIQLRFHHPP